MGLGMLGLLPMPFIERTLAPAVEPARRTGSPLLLGGAFGLCFTPCVTPVLASLLALSASVGTAASTPPACWPPTRPGWRCRSCWRPWRWAIRWPLFRLMRDRYDLVRMFSGLVLVAAGLLVFFDRTFVLNGWVNHITESL